MTACAALTEEAFLLPESCVVSRRTRSQSSGSNCAIGNSVDSSSSARSRVGGYVADFPCREARVIVEVDGATHSTDEEIGRDAARTAALEGIGYRVVRVQNDDVYNAMEGVLGTILAALTSSAR